MTFVGSELSTHGARAVARLAVLLSLLGMSGARAWAQQDAAFLQYWRTETQWNPAAVGRSPQLSISGAVQTHAAGYEQAGSTMWAGADIAFPLGGMEHGVGASFLNDAIGLFSHKQFAVQYALHRAFGRGKLSLGLQADMLQEGFDGAKADLNEASDPALPSGQVSAARFDASAGAAFVHPRFGLSVSFRHATAPTIEWDETHRMKIKSMLNIAANYNIRPEGSLFMIVPSAMLRSDFADWRADVTLRGEYAFEKRRLFGAVNYAPGRSVGLVFGGTVRGLDIAYGYEAFTSGLGIGAGQHEITVAYRLPVDLGKKKRNLHRSVRWL